MIAKVQDSKLVGRINRSAMPSYL